MKIIEYGTDMFSIRDPILMEIVDNIRNLELHQYVNHRITLMIYGSKSNYNQEIQDFLMNINLLSIHDDSYTLFSISRIALGNTSNFVFMTFDVEILFENIEALSDLLKKHITKEFVIHFIDLNEMTKKTTPKNRLAKHPYVKFESVSPPTNFKITAKFENHFHMRKDYLSRQGFFSKLIQNDRDSKLHKILSELSLDLHHIEQQGFSIRMKNNLFYLSVPYSTTHRRRVKRKVIVCNEQGLKKLLNKFFNKGTTLK